MKPNIQIPCSREQARVGGTIDALPRSLPGFDGVEILVIYEGSSDCTVHLMEEHGAGHILRLPRNWWLAHAFAQGHGKRIERAA